MQLYDFQKRTVQELLEATLNPASKRKIIMKSPTGSGKTVMMIEYIKECIQCVSSNIAFIWLCPGKGDLEEQSRAQMLRGAKNYQVNTLHDALASGFLSGSTTFINWEMITKTGNRAITDGEQKNLFDRIAEAKNRGVAFLIIVDEEHSNNTAKAQDIINAFNPIHEIRISATAHKSPLAEWIEVDENEVIAEGVIAKAIYVNEGISSGTQTEDEVKFLIEKGNAKRQEVVNEYKKLGLKINPLMIIQLANAKEAKTERVETILNSMGFTYENGMVGKWLADEKKNTETLKDNSSSVSFLIMKQAISTGWDCPRAKILVKLRDTSDEDFEIQTIGRIRRMPERKHYGSEVLDNCYVFTFDETYKAGLCDECNRAYEVLRLFRKDDPTIKSMCLKKQNRAESIAMYGAREIANALIGFMKREYGLELNRYKENVAKLESKGYRFGDKVIATTLAGKFIKMMDTEKAANSQRIQVGVIANTHVHGIDLQHSIFAIHTAAYVGYEDLRSILTNLFLHSGICKYRLLDLNLQEYYAFIINNEHLLKEVFRRLNAQKARQPLLINENLKDWIIPVEEVVKYNPREKCSEIYSKNVLNGYNAQMVTNDFRSTCEILFENFCEKCSDIKWVYKNGDKGDEYFSIVYATSLAKQNLFYPDYIVRLSNGTVMIVETKGGEYNGQSKNIDKNVVNKFEAFKTYAERLNLRWGFVRDKNNRLYINNTEYKEDMNADEWEILDDWIKVGYKRDEAKFAFVASDPNL